LIYFDIGMKILQSILFSGLLLMISSVLAEVKVPVPMWDKQQPVTYPYPYFVTEKDKSIVTPAADIPAIMVAGIIQTKEFEQNFKRVSLSLDAVLTVSAIGNVAKLKYLKDFASAARLTLAGIELSSTALDLLLNYTDLCVDGELCEALREYNFYLQVGLLSGEALSAIYKSQLKALKLKAAEKYAEKRAKLVAKYGENSKEVKALDEHFGIVKGAGSFLDDALLNTAKAFDDNVLDVASVGLQNWKTFQNRVAEQLQNLHPGKKIGNQITLDVTYTLPNGSTVTKTIIPDNLIQVDLVNEADLTSTCTQNQQPIYKMIDGDATAGTITKVEMRGGQAEQAFGVQEFVNGKATIQLEANVEFWVNSSTTDFTQYLIRPRIK
jgi:hypothetical protein